MEDEKKLALVDPNTEAARMVSNVILLSLQKMVPFNVQLAGIIRLFASLVVIALQESSPEHLESVRGGIVVLLAQINEAVVTYPNIPDHLLMNPKGKVH